MRTLRKSPLYFAGAFVGAAWLLAVHCRVCVADEGMWLFNQLPTQILKEKYGFVPDQRWIDHVMKSSIRLNTGGTGSFISNTGLLLTNHHVAASTLQEVSEPGHDYNREGFLAKTLDEEKPAKSLEILVLQSIEDVTAQVNAAVSSGMKPADANKARKAAIADIEKKSAAATGLRSDVVTLFNGSLYHLYRYKRYTDIRVVWTPESSAANFGGDGDNFEYPRYALDAAILRAYENGKPVKTDDFLRFSANGPKETELVFISGNPGSTSRQSTLDSLVSQRDTRIPFALAVLNSSEIQLQQFGLRGDEAAREAQADLAHIQNSRKAVGGMLLALQDPQVLALKAAQEEELKVKVGETPGLKPYLSAWDDVATAEKRFDEIFLPFKLLEGKGAFNSKLFDVARTLVRMADEDLKLNGARLDEYRDSKRSTLEQALYSKATIYPAYEEFKLANSLSFLAAKLGGENPLVQSVLQGKSPMDRAHELISGTELTDISARRNLAKGGKPAILLSQDPLIRLAASVDAQSRKLRLAYENNVKEVELEAYDKIAKAQLAVQGAQGYPDATFTLRLSFGRVAGYRQAGSLIPAFTDFEGAFEHEAIHGAKSPYALPATWHDAQASLDPKTHLNFVSTVDGTGGDSGSPAVNKDAELVGLIFDGNIQSMAGEYVYDESVNRAIAVSSSALLETLRKVYKAEGLLKELGIQ